MKRADWGKMASVEFINNNGVVIDIDGTDGLGIGIAVAMNLEALFLLFEADFDRMVFLFLYND